MNLRACVMFALLVLAGAQDSVPAARGGKSSGTNAKQPAQAQPPATGDGVASIAPQSMNTPSTPASGDGVMNNAPQSINMNTSSAPATGDGPVSNAQQSINMNTSSAPATGDGPVSNAPQSLITPSTPVAGNDATSNVPQSSLPSNIMPQTNVFSSVVFDQNAQQMTQQMPSSNPPTFVQLAATSLPPIGSAMNSFSSASLPLPSPALQQTSILAFATPQAALPESSIQPTVVPIASAQPTAILTSGTQLAEQPASTILPTAMPSPIDQPTVIPKSGTQMAGQPASTAQPTTLPTPGTQMSEQPASTDQSRRISTEIPVFATQNQFTSTVPAPRSTNVPVKGTTVPTFVPPSSVPESSTPFTVFTLTSTTQAPDTPTQIQIIFNTSYSRAMVNSTDSAAYCYGLAPSIAAVAQVPLYRITSVQAYSQPQTDFLVLRFTVQPFVATSSAVPQAFSTFPSVRARRFADNTGQNYYGTVASVVAQLRTLVLTSLPQFQLIDQNGIVLTVNRDSNDKIFVSWSDDGPCPTDPCRSPDVCVCSLTGTLQCQHQTKPNLLLLLLLLLLIPLVIIIIIIVVVCRERYRKRQIPVEKKQKVEKRVIRADMLSYHEYVAREKDPAQPKVSTIASRGTLNESTLNTLHRSLGEHLSIAFNGSTFIDNTGISDCADNTSRDAILPRDD